MKEWQDGLRALLPNININFGGLPNSSSSSSSSSSNSVNHIGGPVGPAGISHSLSWDSTASWMDPAIITGTKTTCMFASFTFYFYYVSCIELFSCSIALCPSPSNLLKTKILLYTVYYILYGTLALRNCDVLFTLFTQKKTCW